jgi:hypothetical protein
MKLSVLKNSGRHFDGSLYHYVHVITPCGGKILAFKYPDHDVPRYFFVPKGLFFERAITDVLQGLSEEEMFQLSLTWDGIVDLYLLKAVQDVLIDFPYSEHAVYYEEEFNYEM